MPYKENENIESPENWEHPVWRYLSTSQLISILERGKLHFTRTDNFSDPYEGDLPEGAYDSLSYASFTGGLVESMTSRDDMGYFSLNGDYNDVETFRKSFFHSCWNYKKYESKAMWDGKSRDGEGVAIKTTAEKLRESFDSFTQEPVFIGMVEYGDYDNSDDLTINEGSWLNVHLHKPIEFQEERELRVSFTTYPTPSADPFYDCSQYSDGEVVDLNWDEQPKGVKVPINTNTLIEEIYLSPYSDSWQKDVIEKLLESNNIDAEVNESNIYDR